MMASLDNSCGSARRKFAVTVNIRSSRLLTGAVIALVAACATSPTGRKQFMMPNFSDGEVSKMGVSAYEDLKKKQKINKDPQINHYVSCVSNAILASLPEGEGEGWEIN